MGSSADAYLVYGIDLLSEEERDYHWDGFELPEWVDEYDGVEDILLTALGFQPVDWSAPNAREINNHNRELLAPYDVGTQRYGVLDEFAAIAIVIKSSVQTAPGYGSQLVDLDRMTARAARENYDQKLDRVLELLGLELPSQAKRGWLLLSSYG
jgi:hypothetical protein